MRRRKPKGKPVLRVRTQASPRGGGTINPPILVAPNRNDLLGQMSKVDQKRILGLMKAMERRPYTLARQPKVVAVRLKPRYGRARHAEIVVGVGAEMEDRTTNYGRGIRTKGQFRK